MQCLQGLVDTFSTDEKEFVPGAISTDPNNTNRCIRLYCR